MGTVLNQATVPLSAGIHADVSRALNSTQDIIEDIYILKMCVVFIERKTPRYI